MPAGAWIKNNPIPADQASWDVYAKLADENVRYLWGILDRLLTNSRPPRLPPPSGGRSEPTSPPAWMKAESRGKAWQASRPRPAADGGREIVE